MSEIENPIVRGDEVSVEFLRGMKLQGTLEVDGLLVGVSEIPLVLTLVDFDAEDNLYYFVATYFGIYITEIFASIEGEKINWYSEEVQDAQET